MRVRLHNLSARSPVIADLKVVAAVIAASASDREEAHQERVEEEVEHDWHEPGFCLKSDAWVIVTNAGQIIGYADVRKGEVDLLIFRLHICPEYRGRGIGTLLLWLVEERARSLGEDMPAGGRVALATEAHAHTTGARHLLEREGYRIVRHFWRMSIELDETIMESYADERQCGKIKVDLVVDSRTSVGPTSQDKRTGIYTIQQYDVYEKVLRAGDCLQAVSKQLQEPCASA
jgi:GNAT superfamily N-acetyltransferase